jgi:PGF-pre-PGF domain-containing protein
MGEKKMKCPGEIEGNYFTNTAIIILLLIVALLLKPAAFAAHTLDTSSAWKTTTTAWGTDNPATLSYSAGSGSTLMVLGIATEGISYRTAGTPNFNGKSFTTLGRTMPTLGLEGGGGGGGGGGFAPTGSPYCTSFIRELRDGFLKSNSPTTYTFRTQDFGIYEVVITPAKTLGQVDVKVVKCISDLKGVSQFPGIRYIFNDVWASAKELSLDDGIVSLTLRFKVDKSWLLDNNIADSSMKLSWYNGDQWIYLETDIINRDDKYVYYEAITNRLGPFIIGTISIQRSFPQISVNPTGELLKNPVQEEMIHETIVPESTPGVSSSKTLNILVTLLIIVISLSIIVYLMRNK